jgi:hypothetical protein
VLRALEDVLQKQVRMFPALLAPYIASMGIDVYMTNTVQYSAVQCDVQAPLSPLLLDVRT